MADGDLKTVGIFADTLLAQITAGMLNENGIPAAVFGGNSPYPALGFNRGVEVKVNPDDYDAAMKLIETSASDVE